MADITDAQMQMWTEITALHNAWIDRGTLVADTLALYATMLSSVAAEHGIAFAQIESFLGVAYAKVMKLKIAEMQAAGVKPFAPPPSKL